MIDPVLLVFLIVSPALAFTARSWSDASALASKVVSQLTLDEKAGILVGVGQFSSRCVGDTHPVSRLGIPSMCMNDGPAGVRLTKGVTGFPTGINAASTFSRRLMQERGKAMGEEFRGKGINVLLGPAMDIMRSPKAGRAWESAGLDPYLTGEFAYYTITGIQSTGVQACAKHLIANNQEHWRYGLSADIPEERTAREIYWYPFERAVEADVSAVMCAYNRVNQTSSCHNPELISKNGTLRGKLGFKGYVISDWGATHDSVADNANAGLDMEQPGDWILIGGGVYGGGGLQSAVKSGSVSNDTLNEMVTRVLTSWYRFGQDSGYPTPNFDSQHPDGSGSLNQNVVVRTPEHVALVREIGAASAVLLKTNTSGSSSSVTRGLPIAVEKVKKIAIVGQDAKIPNLNCNGLNECNDGTMSIGWGSGSNSLEFIIPPDQAIQSFVGNNATITSSLSNDLSDGPKAAKGADVAFVFVNAMSGELGFYDIVVGNMGDRNDLDLWWKGGSLIEDVAAVCSNTIVIVHSVGPVYMPWSSHPNITGIIYAGAPGEQTGPSIVDVLFGAYNPRGRLPFSIADSEDAYPAPIVYNSGGFPTITYSEGLFLDYRYMDSKSITPRFEFGFGLSYTTFAYSSLSIKSSTSTQGGMTISFVVKNSGSVTGTEIAQLYLGYPSNAGEPKKVLRGFEEVSDVQPGQSGDVTIELAPREMSIWDTAKGQWSRPSGAFTVFIGASIKDIRLQGTF